MGADVVGAVQEWLAGRFPLHRFVTETPGDLRAACPCTRITRVGGGRFHQFSPAVVALETFTVKPQETTRMIAEVVSQALTDGCSNVVAKGAVISRVSCDSSPQVVPYSNSDLRMAVHQYTVHIAAL